MVSYSRTHAILSHFFSSVVGRMCCYHIVNQNSGFGGVFSHSAELRHVIYLDCKTLHLIRWRKWRDCLFSLLGIKKRGNRESRCLLFPSCILGKLGSWLKRRMVDSILDTIEGPLELLNVINILEILWKKCGASGSFHKLLKFG